VTERHRPASEALRDWGKAHRFAGSGDRHFIGTLVYDALRNKLSAGAAARSDAPRGVVFGVLRSIWKLGPDEIETLASAEHGPGALAEVERAALSLETGALPDQVKGNYPEWLQPSLQRVFGDTAVAEMQALATRAPIDLRANTLKATQEQVIDALKGFGAMAGPWSPLAVRIAAPAPDHKHINVEVEASHGRGWFEVQDAASQIAALLSGVKPGETVADICAGAGGKTLAMAALMQNQGKLIAHDKDRHRLRPIFERVNRAGASVIEVLGAADEGQLKPGHFDCVLVDAPCSGSGAWRRKPESKWKLTPKLLEQRLRDQRQVLEKASDLVKRGGRLIYVTCSILPEENTDQVKAFLEGHDDFEVVPYTELWPQLIGGNSPASADGSTETLLLTPRRHDVDGFFVAVMRKRARA
jgi:16S rRNA (cytosine967-C5)-methyltransferase